MVFISASSSVGCVDLFEIVLGSAAKGTDPIIRNVLKIGSRRHTVVGIALFRFVFVSAKLTSKNFHRVLL